MSDRYVALLRMHYDADDEIEALATAKRAASYVAGYLTTNVEVLEVQPASSHLPPEVQRMALRRARNILVGLRTRGALDLARQLDQTIYAFR